MPRFLSVAAALIALGAGAAGGNLFARMAVVRAADAPPASGWSSPVDPAVATNAVDAAMARAVRALRDPASFPPEAIVLFVANADGDGRRLSGESRYVLRFGAGDVVWGLSALDGDDALPAQSGRLSVTSRTADLRRNADGSADVFVQAEPPDDPAANWLPAPVGAFRLAVRAYGLGPDRAVRWRPPPVTRRETAA